MALFRGEGLSAPARAGPGGGGPGQSEVVPLMWAFKFLEKRQPLRKSAVNTCSFAVGPSPMYSLPCPPRPHPLVATPSTSCAPGAAPERLWVRTGRFGQECIATTVILKMQSCNITKTLFYFLIFFQRSFVKQWKRIQFLKFH